LTKSYQNFKFDEPRYHASYYLSLILNDHSWPCEEDLEILETLQPEDLSRFAPTMLSRAFLECYIAGSVILEVIPFFFKLTLSYLNLDLLLFCHHSLGNIECDEAESIIHHVEDVFFNGSHPICKPVLQSSS